MVSDNIRQYLMVSDNISWYQTISHGIRQYLMVSDNISWYQTISHGIRQYLPPQLLGKSHSFSGILRLLKTDRTVPRQAVAREPLRLMG
jgi:hypothetical protein